MSERTYGFETLAIHAGAEPDPTTGARAVPIYQTTSYVFDDVDHAAALFNLQKFGNIYTRLTNPTVSVLEARIAALEGGTAACCTASGHAAQFLTFLNLMQPGQQRRLELQALRRLDRADDPHLPAVRLAGELRRPARAARTSPPRSTTQTRALFVESVSNPDGIVADLEAIAAIAHAHGVPLVVDNTLPTPYLCQPLKWGADIVVHSMTKYLGGQGNSVGGVIVEGGRFDWANGKFPLLTEPTEAYHGLRFYETFGNFALDRAQQGDRPARHGPRPLAVQRVPDPPGHRDPAAAHGPPRRQRRPGGGLARRPTRTSAWVSYPRLPQNRTPLLEKYCPRGLGSVFTFGVKGGYEMGVRLVDSCQLLSHVANIGDTRSLIIHPASTTHRQLDEEQLVAAGAGPDVVRLSIGIETAEDIIADLEQALDAAAA